MTNAQQARTARRKKTLWLVETALLAAVVILMSFTPLGYLKTAGVEITFIMISVVIGAITLGPAAGAILGGLWGVTSFIQCFGMSAFGTALLGINPVLTFIVCVPTRILAGWLSALIFVAFKKLLGEKKAKFIGSPIASLAVALINTALFVTLVIVLFGNSEYISGMRGGMGFVQFFAAFVGLNGVIEAAVTFVVGGAISTALLGYLGKHAE